MTAGLESFESVGDPAVAAGDDVRSTVADDLEIVDELAAPHNPDRLAVALPDRLDTPVPVEDDDKDELARPVSPVPPPVLWCSARNMSSPIT